MHGLGVGLGLGPAALIRRAGAVVCLGLGVRLGLGFP